MDNQVRSFLGRVQKQIRLDRDAYAQAARNYDRMSSMLTIPSLCISSVSTVLTFLSGTPLVADESKVYMMVGIGITGAIAAFLQSCQVSLKYGTKSEMFRTASEQYDQLLLKIQFELVNHNEADFIDKLEKRMLEIQSTCRYSIPRAIYEDDSPEVSSDDIP